ncbi:MAG: adenosylhomocysteinase [Gammaproteobacteria bacterium]|nr:adenosylhomocysteinase [Gammaproteobacteria bacterium]|tara:strand:- start:3890 stop:5239 length:1350 start_codon:yes stop_codon:yes gene_type:complete
MSDFKVRDLALADFGMQEILLAQDEMPALMQLRKNYKEEQPLKGAKIIGCIHMTIQTAVLIETLIELGAEVRWSSCNIFSTQDHAAAAIAKKGIPVFAWKGETEQEYDWCIDQTINKNGKPWAANMILDDGGDLTRKIHEEYPEMLENIHGISEETTTGVKRLEEMLKNGNLKVPAINVNDSITKSKNDNKYGCRHGLDDAIKRGTDMLLAGKKALVIGYGDVGKGSADSLAQQKMIVDVTEIDPICAMQACFDGFSVVSGYKNGEVDTKGLNIDHVLLKKYDLVVTTTGNINVLDKNMLNALKSGCVICNIGHFDNEIDIEYLKSFKWIKIKEGVHKVHRKKNDYLILLGEGRLVNLALATGHPSRVMDGSFCNQVLAQIELYKDKFAFKDESEKEVYVRVLPKKLDEEVASLMVTGFGGTLTKLTTEQENYSLLNKEGPFKNEKYTY